MGPIQGNLQMNDHTAGVYGGAVRYLGPAGLFNFLSFNPQKAFERTKEKYTVLTLLGKLCLVM